MKLVKLSLATIVAAGALSSVASAASLEEAIKNVDVSGYARYRYDARNTNTSDSEFNGNTHRFTTDIDFKSAVGDNFFGVIGFRYDSSDVSGERAGADTQVGQTLNVRQFYLGYTAGNTTIQAGRQVLGTFFTDDMVGTGIKFLNKDIIGLTLVGIAFDNLQADGDIGTGKLNIGPNGSTEKVYDRNLYGVASIGSYDPVSFQAWYAALDSVAQLYAIDVTLGANLGGADLSLQAQYAGSAMWAKNARTLEEVQIPFAPAGVTMPVQVPGKVDDGQFWAIKAGAEAFGFDASVGYVNIDTKKNKSTLISFEDQGSFITAGEDLLDYTLVQADQSIYFVTAGYKLNDYLRVGADYVSAKYDNDSSDRTRYGNNNSYNASEVVLRADYKYNKKLNFKAWFSNIDRDSGRDDVKHLRFEARYNF